MHRKQGSAPYLKIVGMPECLTAAVYPYDLARRQIITMNWATLGEAGRQGHRDYVTAARLPWTRRKRCEQVAKDLAATA